MAPAITITVRAADIHKLIDAAHRSLDFHHLDIEGDAFELEAAIGAIRRSIEKAEQPEKEQAA